MRRIALLLSLLTVQASAQPVVPQPAIVFGSASDPLEATLDPLRAGSGRLAAFGGPSYIGVRWRAALGVEAEGAVGPFAVAAEATVRAGLDGLYQPDVDELYDVLRWVRYARLNPTPRLPVYARLGPLQRVSLGYGDLVHDFGTTTAWDERTVGVEVAVALSRIEAAAFTADIRMNRVVGGRVALRPVATTRAGAPLLGLPSLRLGANAVHDLGLTGADQTTAFSADASLDVMALGDFRLAPFTSYAQFLEYGRSVTVGVSFGSPALADLVRLGASLAVLFTSDQFIPGYFNAFYPVSNPQATIIDSDLYFRNRSLLVPASIPLADATGGTSLAYTLSGGVFGLLEFDHYFRRDFGRRTGAFGVRFAVVPDLGRDVRFAFELGRQGLGGFRGIFSDLADEAVLVFQADYRFSGPFFAFLRSRYGYTRLDDLPDGRAAFLVERRFEPLVGIALVR